MKFGEILFYYFLDYYLDYYLDSFLPLSLFETSLRSLIFGSIFVFFFFSLFLNYLPSSFHYRPLNMISYYLIFILLFTQFSVIF